VRHQLPPARVPPRPATPIPRVAPHTSIPKGTKILVEERRVFEKPIVTAEHFPVLPLKSLKYLPSWSAEVGVILNALPRICPVLSHFSQVMHSVAARGRCAVRGGFR
jgi:hypothetical protein